MEQQQQQQRQYLSTQPHFFMNYGRLVEMCYTMVAEFVELAATYARVRVLPMIVLWRLQMHTPWTMLSCCLLMNQLGPLHLPALGASTQ